VRGTVNYPTLLKREEDHDTLGGEQPSIAETSWALEVTVARRAGALVKKGVVTSEMGKGTLTGKGRFRIPP